MTKSPNKRVLLILFILIFPISLFNYIDLTQANALGVFTSVVLLWFSEIIPLAATGLMVPCLAVLTGVMDPTSAFAPFGNQILFLFVGSFLIAQAMQKHGWDKRMAYIILSSPYLGRTPNGLVLIISLICWFLSMWISNTATCAIVTPMAIGILNTLSDNFEDRKSFKNFSIRLMLVCAFASSIGGMATPVGSPPNLLAIQFLAAKGIHIDFFQWMFFALPISLIMLVALHFILKWRYPVAHVSLVSIKVLFNRKLVEMGAIRRSEWQVGACFLIAVILWVSPGLVKSMAPDSDLYIFLKDHFPMGIVALISSLILFILPDEHGVPNITWEDAKQIDWGTIMIFGGGLVMGAILDQSGLAVKFGSVIFAGGLDNIALTGATAILAGILISEFSSNTASTSIIVPILLGTFASVDPAATKMLVVACAFGASFGFMLPVSTPPNAIVFSTGRIPLKQMARTGVIFDISGFILIFLFIVLIFPRLGLL